MSTRVDVPLAIGALEMPPSQVGLTDDPSPTRMATEWLINCSEARILTEKLRLGVLLLLLLLLLLFWHSPIRQIKVRPVSRQLS